MIKNKQKIGQEDKIFNKIKKTHNYLITVAKNAITEE